VRQYGRVPEAGRRIRFSQYRHGGGVAGNVPAGKIQVMSAAVPYIDRVVNLQRADGGRDQESLEEAKMRAARELRAQRRAVTAEDFENLGKAASRAIARVKCNTPDLSRERDPNASPLKKGPTALSPGTVELLVVPAAVDALRAGDLSKLYLEEDLRERLFSHLDQYRLLTTTLHIREPRYLGIQVRAEIVPAEYSQPEVVRARVEESLKHLITPLALGGDAESLGPDWEGWPFGRDLYVSEIYSLIQKVAGVKHVLDVRLSYRQVVPSKERASPGSEASPGAEAEEAASAGKTLTKAEQKIIPIAADMLCCSLDHDIRIVEL
jgi:predicted phage baseplate assembly protein